MMYNNNSVRSVAKFSISSHQLEIDKGRHAALVIPKEQTLFNRCKQDVNDEIHSLMFVNISMIKK